MLSEARLADEYYKKQQAKQELAEAKYNEMQAKHDVAVEKQ